MTKDLDYYMNIGNRGVVNYLYRDVNDLDYVFEILYDRNENNFFSEPPVDIRDAVKEKLITAVNYNHVVEKALCRELFNFTYVKALENTNYTEKNIKALKEAIDTLTVESYYTLPENSVSSAIEAFNNKDWFNAFCSFCQCIATIYECVEGEVNDFLGNWYDEDIEEALHREAINRGLIQDEDEEENYDSIEDCSQEIELSDEEYDEGFDESLKRKSSWKYNNLLHSYN